MSKLIKLRAIDRTDLTILAACLQDAIVPVQDMCFLTEEKKFVLVANRFKWETGAQPFDSGDGGSRPVYERTNCGLTIDGVEAVRRRNLDLRKPGTLLELLTIQPDADGLILAFAGDVSIRLEAPKWECRLEDIGEPWPSRRRPGHDIVQDDSEAPAGQGAERLALGGVR